MFNTKEAPQTNIENANHIEMKLIYRVQKMKPQCYDIAPCRKIIAVGYSNKHLIFWNIENCQKTIDLQLSFTPIQLFYSDDGKYQLIRSKESHKIIYLLEIQKQKYQTIIAKGCCLFSTIIMFNLNYEAIVMGFQQINLINLQNKGSQKQINFQSQSLCPIRSYICSINCQNDIGEIGIYKICQYKKIRSLYMNLEKGNVNLCTNSQFIICSSRAKNRVWNVQTMKLIRKKSYGNYEIKELIINHLVFFSINEIGIIVWNVGTGRHRIIVKGNNLVSIRALSNGQLLYRSNWQINLIKIF